MIDENTGLVINNCEPEQREVWGSRFGYMMATLGMAIGLGAMWRFPYVVAMNGGGAFVLAYIIISLLIAVPGAIAEVSFGKWARTGPVDAFQKILGKGGKVIGSIVPLVPLGMNMYYLVIVGWVLAYIFFTITGSYANTESVAFFTNFVSNKWGQFAWAMLALALTATACLGGIKGGIEKICKYMLPLLYIILIVLLVRVLTLPGIVRGIEYYTIPDWKQLFKPELWVSALGMALFAMGLGPAFLLTYGSYLPDKADCTLDILTVAIWNILGCLMSGFIIIPSVILYNLDLDTGPSLVFTVLPKVFKQMPGSSFVALTFFVALFFAGYSSGMAIMEVPVTAVIDSLGWNRKKTVLIITLITAIGIVPCIWNDTFLLKFDYITSNLGYTLATTFVIISLAWFYGAKKVREEWLNPTSEIKLGPWYDFLLKYITTPVLIYLLYEAVKAARNL